MTSLVVEKCSWKHVDETTELFRTQKELVHENKHRSNFSSQEAFYMKCSVLRVGHAVTGKDGTAYLEHFSEDMATGPCILLPVSVTHDLQSVTTHSCTFSDSLTLVGTAIHKPFLLPPPVSYLSLTKTFLLLPIHDLNQESLQTQASKGWGWWRRSHLVKEGRWGTGNCMSHPQNTTAFQPQTTVTSREHLIFVLQVNLPDSVLEVRTVSALKPRLY